MVVSCLFGQFNLFYFLARSTDGLQISWLNFHFSTQTRETCKNHDSKPPTKDGYLYKNQNIFLLILYTIWFSCVYKSAANRYIKSHIFCNTENLQIREQIKEREQQIEDNKYKYWNIYKARTSKVFSKREQHKPRGRLKERIEGIPLQLPKTEQNPLPADCGHPLRRGTNTSKKWVNCRINCICS